MTQTKGVYSGLGVYVYRPICPNHNMAYCPGCTIISQNGLKHEKPLFRLGYKSLTICQYFTTIYIPPKKGCNS